MRIPMFALALGAACLSAPAHAQVEDRLVYVEASDPEMNAAKDKGQATLPDFFAHVARPQRGETSFSIKFDLLPEPDKVEYIWGEVISRSPGVTIIRLSNSPYDNRWALGDKVSVDDTDVIDWGYFKDGVMQGNFTTRALLSHIDPAEADAIRAAYRW